METAGVRFVGDEMLVWSDLDGAHGPGPARGAVLAPFLAAARGRTLVAGPHAAELLDALPEVTVLVRGVKDAELLAGREGRTVLCGSPATLSAEGTFDTIIALAGLEVLDTAETDGLTWAEILAMLKNVLEPGGVLVVGVENPLGVHRLAAPRSRRTDAEWTPVPDETRPVNPDALRAAAGAVGRVYSVYPGLEAPELILDGNDRSGVAESALARAFTGTDDMTADPVELAIESLRCGVGPVLAPGWIVVAARDEESLPDIKVGPQRAVSGPTLERCLVHAAARQDLPVLRALLADWQSGENAGVPADQIISGLGGALSPLVEPGDPGQALRALAVRLLRGGFPHPWPAVTGVDDLTRTLAGMAGRDIDPASGAGSAPGDIDPASGAGFAPGDTYPASGAGSLPGGLDAPEPRRLPFAELVAYRERLTRELSEVRAQAAFFETELTAREADLRGAQRMVELLSGKGPARAGQAFVGGVRAARRVLRRRG
ncbi:hypothetical protein [Winogradskya humida]|uniref:Methyltransferase family protein n=1 Tax=Winogradskya humida TaxID=113566 RepID=A0ABQ3ZHW5_9ACTN|nr:hypothetical protein [Actinoplanes humidus]GIE18137.1 hypothetical protein Ahu01nite_012390 [Actinoplanes humidus]